MMKRHLFSMGTLLVAALTLGGCSSEDDLTTYGSVWKVTGTATKDADPEITRGMSIGGDNGKTLYFNWDGDETIEVINAAGTSVGPLSVTVNPSNPALATVNGEITGTYAVGDKVTYYVPSVEMDLTGQKGTMADLSKNFSYLTASVTVLEVDAEQKAITMGGASFTRRPAILRLRLTDADGNRLNVEELKISSTSGHLVKSIAADGTKTYYAANEELTITNEKEDGAYPNEFFIALLNDYDNKDTYSFTAKVGNSYYSSVTDAQKITAKFVAGKYYNGLRKLTKTVDGDVETTGDFTFSTINPQQYTGSQITPDVTVYYQGTPLTAGTDYELHYFDNVNVGRAFVVAVGKGTTYGEKAGVTTFTINSATISESMLTAIGTQTYTGSPIEPTVTMTGLTQGTDYTVSYADNTNVGTATATITAIGNYSGELETTFTIQKATPTITLTTTEMKLKPEDTETRSATTDFGTVTYESSNTAVATVDATGKVTAVADGTATITASVAADDNWNAASKQYTVTVSSVTVPDGAISGVFSVSATKKVYFSKGNLKYNGSTWSFFDNQYDYYTSYSAGAWDHFGWSTSKTNYGMNTSQINSDYYGDFADWGNNSELQSALGTGWFTLSSAEWTYLFNTRSASTMGGTSNGRYAKAKVNNVQGIILFPDTYTHPDGVTAPTGVNAKDATGWNGNNYSSADWTKMESAGAVFLPAAGERRGTTVADAGSKGYYWSSTAPGPSFAYYVYFDSGDVKHAIYDNRGYGSSVRLVWQVK